MVRFITRALVLAGVLGGVTLDVSAESPTPRSRRDVDGPSQHTRRDAENRRPRRDLESGAKQVRSAEELMRAERTLAVDWTGGGCAINRHDAFAQRLLGLQNSSELMSLEVWGDAEEYVPYDRVTYYLRVPRTAYVTLFWIGPKHDVSVVFENLRVPAERDVSVNPDAIVVPPLGREQWVALATLEPFDFPCQGDERDYLAWVSRVVRAPHGVGRWEVMSRPTRTVLPDKPRR